jgi:hypothetical protein
MDIAATWKQTYSPEVEVKPNGPEICSPTRKQSKTKIRSITIFRTVEAMARIRAEEPKESD